MGVGSTHPTGRQPRSAEQREAAAQEILSSIDVSPAVVSSTLAAAQAIADFGIQEGVRLVHVRILEELDLDLRLEAGHDLALSEAPEFCLVGPFSAPDDAGLEDRCWGEPDLGAVVSAQLPSDDGGHPTFRTGEPLIVRSCGGRVRLATRVRWARGHR